MSEFDYCSLYLAFEREIKVQLSYVPMHSEIPEIRTSELRSCQGCSWISHPWSDHKAERNKEGDRVMIFLLYSP